MFTIYFWRKLHCLFHMRVLYTGGWDTRAFWRDDAGYCLDRYYLEDYLP